MKIAQVQFTSWDKLYNYKIEDFSVSEGDMVIVKTDTGQDLAKVVSIIDGDKANSGEELSPITRMATVRDLENLPSETEKAEAIKFAINVKKKYDLPMKFIDVHFSFDGSKVILAFIADGRVDFREMVKDLTRHFGKSIRLQQIGIRDEAKIMGDCGHCGKPLCCKTHLKELSSITSEMAELQECSHRGSDRISGICGRLLCCLAYEQEGYEEMNKKMPKAGARVNVDGKKGVIVNTHSLKRTVDVEFPDPENKGQTTVIEVDLDRHKKK